MYKPICAFFILASAILANSPPIIELNDHTEEYDLSAYLFFYEDKTNQTGIQDIIKEKENYNFIKNQKAIPGFGYTSSAIWGHFLLKDNSTKDKDWILRIDYPVLSDITIYFKCKNEIIEKKGGALTANKEKDIISHNILFNINFPCKETLEVFFRVSSFSTIMLPVNIYSTNSFLTQINKEISFYGIYFGVLLVMIIYNLFIFISLRDSVYLYYILYVFFFLCMQIFRTAYYMVLFPETDLRYFVYLASPAGGMTLVFVTLFSRSLLSLHKISEKLTKITDIFIAISLLNTLNIFVSSYIVYNKILNILVLLGMVFWLLIGILGIRRKNKLAYYYFAGWMFFILGIGLYILGNLGIFTNNFFSRYLIFLGSAFEITVFSLALAFRINLLKKEKEEAQEESIKNKEMAIESLKRNDRIKNEFLANTSHELRSPLSGIIGIAESLFEENLGKLNQNIKQNLFLIVASGKRLANIVDDIMDFSSLKNKELKLDITLVDLYTATEIVTSFLSIFVKKKNIKLINNISKTNFMVYADENRLQQILYNLINNAIKFTDSGSVTIKAKRNNKKKAIQITVEDTGIGIAKEDFERIFTSFNQLNSSETREYEGAGLGLSISKNLIELHGGEIWIESEPEKGSRFHFTMPVHQKKAARNISKKPFFKESNFIQKVQSRRHPEVDISQILDNNYSLTATSKILAVDDDPINLRVISNLLTPLNFNIITALSGKEALKIIDREIDIDLILLDIMMPHLSGYEVCKKIREKYSKTDLPIIIFTAKAFEEDLILSFDAGANDYITKPINKNEMVTRVNSALELKKSIHEKIKLTAIEKELDIAAKIQKNIIQSKEEISNLLDIDIDIQYLPANEKVSGDYYHIAKKDRNKISIFLADAIGHGIYTAFSTARIDLLNRHISNYENLHDKLQEINDFMLEKDFKSDAFFTCFICEINQNKLFYASAGHPEQLLIKSKEKTLVPLKTKGAIAGLTLKNHFMTKSIPIENGDFLILFTDGIYEQFNNKQKEYGDLRFYDFIKNKIIPGIKNKKASEISEEIIKEINNFRDNEPINDDITLIVAKL
ncbi:MAG: ATP-binding protein [Spirochaetia bacterium]|nr:ATP-binding protein [Spirochaetia bacterium]